ncbi:hypothetical protein D3C72_1862090 [compost metagenome]
MAVVRRLLGNLGRHDDLVVAIHGGLGVVGLHEALGGTVEHNTAVGVGEILLSFRLGHCFRGVFHLRRPASHLLACLLLLTLARFELLLLALGLLLRFFTGLGFQSGLGFLDLL